MAAARKKMDAIVSRNQEQQRKIIMAQPDAVRNQLREANPDLFESIANDKKAAPKPAEKPAAKKAEGTKESPLDLPTNKNELVAGKVYNTRKGLATWDGTQFTMVK